MATRILKQKNGRVAIIRDGIPTVYVSKNGYVAELTQAGKLEFRAGQDAWLVEYSEIVEPESNSISELSEILNNEYFSGLNIPVVGGNIVPDGLAGSMGKIIRLQQSIYQ